jgi:hypothetical protein
MNNVRYLIADAEMGGRELHFSLLTSFFMVMDEDFKVLGELDLKTKPDDGIYILSGQGMTVNGINIQEHDKIAIPYKQAKPLLYDFLKRMAQGKHLVPVGHGIRGDISHFQKYLISEGSWEQYCSYHYIDTGVVLQYLRACSKLPYDTDGSVGALASYFNIDVDKNVLHTARYDTGLIAEVFQKMVELGKN